MCTTGDSGSPQQAHSVPTPHFHPFKGFEMLPILQESCAFYAIVTSSETYLGQIFPSFMSHILAVKYMSEKRRTHRHKGFPGSSAGKESACNAGGPNSIPGSGRSPGEWIDYPHQYSWASLVAQLVKNLPAMRETWVPSLGWEDRLEKGKATPSSILAWRIPWTV